ncbi:hypothetical protein LGH70_06105 [Hymenobacter sp. BT635]|uniref:Uncharacterized protein n=1 Tax=Hymenobacter nitidus TaxID=2880929 RepID=A0ABS8AA34_9BACT|nr:hypothetical protein [Hymenobacter nitidus]MCB2377146.1 hypothetical protein [Hymenobacter nitidus]
MPLPAISDTLHDKVVERFSFDLFRKRLVVLIWSKQGSEPITWLQLTISGIQNIEEIQQMQAEVDSTLTKKNRAALGYRIDTFAYQEQLVSRPGAMHLLLYIDHLPPMRLDCAKFTLQHISPSAT